MELLIVCLCIGNMGILAVMFLYLTRIEKIIIDFGEKHVNDLVKLSMAVQQKFNEYESKTNPPAHVSDPFKRAKEQYQSTKHIVVPKTPDEIRNENYEEIKKGAEYGSID